MIEWFPHERAPLGRTRLRYIDLDAVLTDGKVERASKAPGFVLLFYGEEMDVIFVVDGEPLTAVRIADRQRSVVPLGSVKRRASAEKEWADVAYFQAPEPQLRAMYATACNPPDVPSEQLDPVRPAKIFTRAREHEYSGVIEFVEHSRKVHYMVFMEGLPVHAFFADQRRASDRRTNESLSTRLERLFEPTGDAVRATGYPHVERIPVQAPVALVEVYRDLVAAGVALTGSVAGPSVALRCFTDALQRQPALNTYRLAENGRLEGESVAPVEQLTAGVAALLFDALTAADRAGAPSPAEALERITRENRFLLQANGFFERFPWPLEA